MKTAHVVLGKLTQDQALYFARELRSARATALADSEGWQALISIFERLAKFMNRCQGGTIGQLDAAQAFFRIIGGFSKNIGPEPHIRLLLEQVVAGRNSEFHGGAAARRFAKHCVEFSFLLEEGLKNIMNKNLGSVMSSPVIAVEPWQMLADVRRSMLENSFTWIPVRNEKDWLVVSDHALVRYLLRSHEALKTKTVNEALSEVNGLAAPVLKIFYEGTETRDEKLLEILAAGPVLVSSSRVPSSDRVIGVVTAFDLL